MIMMLYKEVIQNLWNTIAVSVLYVLLLYWCFGKDCEKVGHVMGISTILIAICIYQIHKGLKQYHGKFVIDWKTKQEKNLYESLLFVLKDPVCILDQHGILFQNRACEQNLEMNNSNFKSVLETFRVKDGESLSVQIEEKFVNSEPSNISFKEFIRKNTANSKHRLYKIFIIDNTLKDIHKTLALVFRDLTEEKELEEKRAQQKFQQLLFLSISHEVRTPLNAIQGLLTYFGGLKVLPEDFHNKIRAGKVWCKILSNEISSVLDYAHIAFNKFQIHLRQISTSKLIQQIRSFLCILLGEKGTSE